MESIPRPRSDLHVRLLWIVILRVAVLAPLLALAAILKTEHIADSLGLLSALVCLLSLFHLVSLRFLRNPPAALYLQMVTDILFITLLIFRSEDLNSIFVPLYLLVIVYSSVLDQRRGGIWSTAIAMLFFLGVISFGGLKGIPSEGPLFLVRETALRISLNLISFAGVGFLGVHLTKRLNAANVALGQTEDSLAELQTRHENMVNSIRSGLFTTDLQGRITSLNPAGEEITGHVEADVLNRPCSVVLGDSALKRLLQADFRGRRRTLRSDAWVRDAAGRRRYLGFSMSPLLSQSRGPIGFIASFQDLTEIKKLEEEVRLNEKMAAIGNLVAGIAHELRNPLGSIAGSVQVLKGSMALTGDRARLLEIVLKESARLNKIVEDLLCYAKPRALQLIPVALDCLLEETLQLVQNDPALARYSIRVEKPMEARLCLANPDQIKQVFWNLISNAAKAMPEGGPMTVRLEYGERYAKILFRDGGTGMSRKQREKLFQPFAGSFTNGLGLGMAIVYQIVRKHRGKIWVRSRLHQGTTIIVALPLRHPQVCESPASQFDVAANDRLG